MKIHFEDNGQDFLTWEVDEEGQVIGCHPFQAAVWCGKYVLQQEYLCPGHSVFYSDIPIVRINQPIRELKHKVESITK